MSGPRRRGRVSAMQVLYEIDMSQHNPEAILSRQSAEGLLLEESALFTRELVMGVLQHQGEIDALIHEYAPLYPVVQLSPIDRNILRLAIYEMLFVPEVPLKVAINEAVELAKIFGSDSSSRFVNGVLGSVSNLAARSPTAGGELKP